MFPQGPPAWPPPREAVRAALESAYATGDWGRYHGRHGTALRERMAGMLGGAHVQLCCSGTFAVELALRALQVGPGQEVILAGYDFGGNFRAVEDVGAFPVLVDLAPGSWCLSPEALESAITSQTAAVIVSHLHGTLADMPQIREIADRRGIAIVEDACQCPGATIGGRQAGTWGDAGVWSFGGSKLLTAGRGGAMFTPRAEVAQRAAVYCERGNDAFPLSELQAAVLLPQLDLLEQEHRTRAQGVEAIMNRAASLECLQFAGKTLDGGGGAGSPAFYKLGMWFNLSPECDISLDRFLAAVQAEGVALDRGFRGFTRRPASRCRKVGDLPHSQYAAQATLVLHHPVLREGEAAAEKVAAALARAARYASGR